MGVISQEREAEEEADDILKTFLKSELRLLSEEATADMAVEQIFGNLFAKSIEQKKVEEDVALNVIESVSEVECEQTGIASILGTEMVDEQTFNLARAVYFTRVFQQAAFQVNEDLLTE